LIFFELGRGVYRTVFVADIVDKLAVVILELAHDRVFVQGVGVLCQCTVELGAPRGMPEGIDIKGDVFGGQLSHRHPCLLFLVRRPVHSLPDEYFAVRGSDFPAFEQLTFRVFPRDVVAELEHELAGSHAAELSVVAEHAAFLDGCEIPLDSLDLAVLLGRAGGIAVASLVQHGERAAVLRARNCRTSGTFLLPGAGKTESGYKQQRQNDDLRLHDTSPFVKNIFAHESACMINKRRTGVYSLSVIVIGTNNNGFTHALFFRFFFSVTPRP